MPLGVSRLVSRLPRTRWFATCALAVGAALGAASCTPAGGTGPSNYYVALGDSYTAGPLIPNQQPNPPGCLRSDHNYPHLTASAKGWRLTDVSCSGATTANITGPQATSAGTNPPQIDALSAATRVVTLGIGGNDIGFSSIIQNCIAGSPFGPTKVGQYCQQYYDPDGVPADSDDKLYQAIQSAEQRIEQTLAAIHSKAPNATVYLVGYPDILPLTDPAVGCWPQLPLTYHDVPYLRQVEGWLNQALVQAAGAQNATYVNTFTASVGHDACTLPTVRYIEPLVPASPAAPVHPNASGEQFLARMVEQTIH